MDQDQSLNPDFAYCLAASPNFNQDGLIFAAKKSGLYRSNDKGQTWTNAYTSLQLNIPLPTTYVAVSSVDAVLYVFACVAGNLLRSIDGGETWQIITLGSPAPVITALAISTNFAKDGTLIAATMQDGIFCSIDYGQKMTGWDFGLYDPNINALALSPDFADTKNVLAGTQSSIFSSRNAGRSWRDLDFPIDAAPVLCLAFSRGVIYAGTETEGLYCSQDNGQGWEQIIPGIVEHILADLNGNIVIVLDGVLRFSQDGGITWQDQAGLDWEITCLAAPHGLAADHPLLVGLSNGDIVTLPSL